MFTIVTIGLKDQGEVRCGCAVDRNAVIFKTVLLLNDQSWDDKIWNNSGKLCR